VNFLEGLSDLGDGGGCAHDLTLGIPSMYVKFGGESCRVWNFISIKEKASHTHKHKQHTALRKAAHNRLVTPSHSLLGGVDGDSETTTLTLR